VPIAALLADASFDAVAAGSASQQRLRKLGGGAAIYRADHWPSRPQLRERFPRSRTARRSRTPGPRPRHAPLAHPVRAACGLLGA